MSPRKQGIPPEQVKLLPGEAIFKVEIGRLRRPFPFTGSAEYRSSIGRFVLLQTEWGNEVGRLAEEWHKPNRNILGSIVQLADRSHFERVLENKRENALCEEVFKKSVAEEKLSMKLVAIEHSIDLTRTTFYYTAKGRVDFRNLVKVLAGKLKRRIELFQVAQKDSFICFPTIGVCGRQVCCQNTPELFDKPIPSRCARVQGLAHSPEKTAGVCGKTRCCLLYEMESYEEFQGFLRREGTCFVPRDDAEKSVPCGGCRVKVLDWNVPLNKVFLRNAEKPRGGAEETIETEIETFELSLEELKKNFVRVE